MQGGEEPLRRRKSAAAALRARQGARGRGAAPAGQALDFLSNISLTAESPADGGAHSTLRRSSAAVDSLEGHGIRQASAAVPTRGGRGGRHSAHHLKRRRTKAEATADAHPPASPEEGLRLAVSASPRRATAPDLQGVPSLVLPARPQRRANHVYYTPSSNHSPVSVCSILPYRRKDVSSARGKQQRRAPTTPERKAGKVTAKVASKVSKAPAKMSTKTAKKATLGKSYRHLLRPHTLPYDPTLLDDPRLTTGKHRTIMNLPGMRVTLFPYVRSSELRDELNERFQQTHPDSTITLTKIRSLKQRMLQCGIDIHLDLSVIAVAYVCLEKLISYGYVTKESRKCDAAVCLLLATKFYHYSMAKSALGALLEAMEKHLGASPREVMAREMLVYTRLQFDISARPEDIRPHYVRLQNKIRSTTDSVLVEYRHFAVHDFDTLSTAQHGLLAQEHPPGPPK